MTLQTIDKKIALVVVAVVDELADVRIGVNLWKALRVLEDGHRFG